MRLAGMDGKNLPYSEGVTRYLMMLWMGLGFYIPILSLVMILRSAWRCWKEEPQPWDDGVAYTAKPFRLRYAASLILTVLLVLIVGEAVNSWSQLPPNRGDLTVAEFAENYNRQAEYLDFGGRAYLDEDGQWQEKPEDGSQIISLEDLMDVNPWDDAKAFHYTVEDGHVTAVTMSGTFQNTTAMWVETPDSYVPQIVTALVAQGGAFLVSLPAGPAAGAGGGGLGAGLHPSSAGGNHHGRGGADRLLLLPRHGLAAGGGGQPPLLHLHRGPGQRMTGSKTARRGDLSVPCR